ncbi:MAG: hypothetical protein HZA54_13790 [Planctomycetes bacterium]|nr:hypothetical protein [Planctomycetota bacterium]
MTMNLEYDPGFLDAVVTDALRRAEAAGDRAAAADLQSALEPVYRMPAGGARDQAFAREQLRTFRQLGLERAVLAGLAEFPELARRVDRLILCRATTRREEEADVLPAEKGRAVRLRVLPDRLTGPAGLVALLRVELTRILDLLDPEFAFVPCGRLADRPAEENLTRDRYRLFWTLSVEGRLAAAGRGEAGAAPRARTELDRLYASLPEEGRERLFLRYWTGPRPTHAEIRRLARETAAVLAAAGLPHDYSAHPTSGMPCPLCRFPAFDWAPAPASARVVRAVLQDFPEWTATAGLCGRCFELYDRS